MQTEAAFMFVIGGIVWLLLDIQRKIEEKRWKALIKQLEVTAVCVGLCYAFKLSLVAEPKYGPIMTGLAAAAVSTGYHKILTMLAGWPAGSAPGTESPPLPPEPVQPPSAEDDQPA
jgi:hypothetical protein